MKNWIIRNKLIWLGAAIGAIAGYLYWKFVGCASGTCAITSSPVNSSVYFGVLGATLLSMFIKKDQKQPSTVQQDEVAGKI